MDDSYIGEAIFAVRRYANVRGRSCEIAYTPGNGTLYPLVFVPVGFDALDLYSASDDMDDPRRRSIFRDEHPHTNDQDGWMLVAWLGHGAWIFRIAGETPEPPHPSYVREKFAGCTEADAAELARLFAGIAGQPYRGPMGLLSALPGGAS